MTRKCVKFPGFSIPGSGAVDPNDVSDLVGVTLLRGTTILSQHTTIGDAMAAAVAGDTVVAGKGVYNENVVMVAGVTLTSASNPLTDTVIQGQGGGPALTLANGSLVESVSIIQHTDGSDAVYANLGGPAELATLRTSVLTGDSNLGAAVNNEGDGTLLLLNIVVNNNTKGFAQCYRGVGPGLAFLREWIVGGSADDIVLVEDGRVEFTNIRTLTAGASYTNGIRINGPDAEIQGDEVHFFIGVTNAFVFDSNSDGCDVELQSGDLFGTTWDVLVNAPATGAGTAFRGNVMFRQERTEFTPGWAATADVNMSHVDKGIQDESALKVMSNFQVGKQGIGFTSDFGEGGPTTQHMRVFTDDGTGTNFVDETEAASSKDGSTFQFWQGVGAGNVTYIGNERRQMFGQQANITVAIILGAGAVVIEYWNGVSWVAFRTMATRADPPVQQLSGSAGLGVGNVNLRYGDIQDTWVATSVNGVAAFWIRFRITSALTQSPVMERILLHPSYTRVNKDGFVEFFGDAERVLTLNWHRRLDDDLSGSSPANGAISFSASVTITPVDNRFSATALDGNGGILELPIGFDFSRDLEIEIDWIGKSNSAGDVEFELITVPVEIGDVLDGSLAESSQTIVESVPVNEANVLRRTIFDVDVSLLMGGDLLAFAYQRDSTGGNPNDTYPGNVDIVRVVIRGTSWS